jgi:hypothetical protein
MSKVISLEPVDAALDRAELMALPFVCLYEPEDPTANTKAMPITAEEILKISAELNKPSFGFV